MKGKVKYLGLMVLIAVFISGCSLFGQKGASVAVKLVLEDGTTVNNQALTMKNGSTSVKATTDSEGKAKFKLDAAGQYTLEGEVLLYDNTKEAISKSVTLKAGSNPDITHKVTTIGLLDISILEAADNSNIPDSKLVISIGEKSDVLPLVGSKILYAKVGTYALKAKVNSYETEAVEVALQSKRIQKSFKIVMKLSVGKKYELSSNIVKHDNYGDPNDTKLTDGVWGNIADVGDPSWSGARPENREENDLCYYIIDLEKIEQVGSVRVQAFQQTGWGIVIPPKITVELSEDKTTWSEPIVVNKTPDTNLETAEEFYDFAAGKAARYVKVTVKPNYTWFWLGEIAVLR